MTTIPPRNLSRSNAQYKAALKRLPLGVASTFRYWGDDRTIYVDHGKGGRVWDIDGNNYVDYRLGYGPAILGYADDRVDAAAREGMNVGGVFALSTERELIVAELAVPPAAPPAPEGPAAGAVSNRRAAAQRSSLTSPEPP